MRIGTVAKGIVNTKLFKYPFYCHFYVTRRCNFRCKMCNVWTHGDRKGEMTLDQIKRAADILQQLHVPNIVISGGEPFLRRELPAIIRVFAERGVSIRLQFINVLSYTPLAVETTDALSFTIGEL